MLRTLIVAAFVASLCVPAWGQAKPAGGAGNWQVGAGFSFGSPDYTQPLIKGATAYAAYDLATHSGMIAEVHLMNLSTPQYIGESSFLVGARYGISEGRFRPYIKLLIGIGLFERKQGTYPGAYPKTTTDGYEAFAAGAGLEYRLSSHVNLLIMDFEYQGWPAFPTNGLTPWIATTGIARRF